MDMLIKAVAGFKEKAVVCSYKAFNAYGSKETVKRSLDLGKELATEYPQGFTWSYLIGFSYYVIGGQQSAYPVVGFYNPWADVLTLTVWDIVEGRLKIIDLEVVPGDCIRGKWKSTSPKPYWMRINDLAPNSLGTAVARTIFAFEKRFPARWKGTWRKRFSLPKTDASKMKYIYTAVALRIGLAMKGPELLRGADQQQDRFLYQCQQTISNALNELKHGRADKVVRAASNTPRSSAAVLRNMPPKWYGGLSLTAVLGGEGACQVFLARMNGEPVAFSALMMADGEGVSISRFDLVDYPTYLKLLGKGK
jgi:hypothetical protein